MKLFTRCPPPIWARGRHQYYQLSACCVPNPAPEGKPELPLASLPHTPRLACNIRSRQSGMCRPYALFKKTDIHIVVDWEMETKSPHWTLWKGLSGWKTVVVGRERLWIKSKTESQNSACLNEMGWRIIHLFNYSFLCRIAKEKKKQIYRDTKESKSVHFAEWVWKRTFSKKLRPFGWNHQWFKKLKPYNSLVNGGKLANESFQMGLSFRKRNFTLSGVYIYIYGLNFVFVFSPYKLMHHHSCK